jgi:hypothetical protein
MSRSVSNADSRGSRPTSRHAARTALVILLGSNGTREPSRRRIASGAGGSTIAAILGGGIGHLR